MNKREIKRYLWNGRAWTLQDLADEIGVPRRIMLSRLSNWSIKDAMETPVSYPAELNKQPRSFINSRYQLKRSVVSKDANWPKCPECKKEATEYYHDGEINRIKLYCGNCITVAWISDSPSGYAFDKKEITPNKLFTHDKYLELAYKK